MVLVLGLLVGGYGVSYGVLREVSVSAEGLVMMEYPGWSTRSYATTRETALLANCTSMCFPAHHAASGQTGTSWSFETSHRHGWLFRGFALAERIEIAARGMTLYQAVPADHAWDVDELFGAIDAE